MAGYFSRTFDPPTRPSTFGPQADPEDALLGDNSADQPRPRRPFFSLDPAIFLGALNSPQQYPGSLARLGGTASPVMPTSYRAQQRSPSVPAPETGAAGPVALNWLQKLGVTSDIRDHAMEALCGMTGDAFSEDELGQILDQVIDNIPYKDTDPFRSIRMNQGRIELTPEQYGIVWRQLEMLSPDFRDRAKAALQKARDGGQVTCPQCP